MEDRKMLYILGDSISLHYGPYLDYILKSGEYFSGLLRLYPENTSSTDKLLELLEADVRNFPESTVIWNSGLHDVRHKKSDNAIFTTQDDYIENLEKIYNTLKHKGFTHQIFINTTPVYDERHNNRSSGWERHDLDVKYYNEKAADLMRKLGVPVIDLYSFTKNFGEDALFDHVHFKPQVRADQAAFLAKQIYKLLNIKY